MKRLDLLVIANADCPELQVPRECPEDIVDLIHECTVQNPALRPDMKQCFDRVKARPISSTPTLHEKAQFA